MTMSEISERYDFAQAVSDLADLANRKGLADQASRLFRIAFDLAEQCADALADQTSLEPSRSIIHHQAAIWAEEIGNEVAPAALVRRALAGNPQGPIRYQLLAMQASQNIAPTSIPEVL